MEIKQIFNAVSSFNKLWNTKILREWTKIYRSFFKRGWGIKDGAYVINLDKYADVGTHWIALFHNRNEIVCFDSYGVQNVPEEIKEFIGTKNIRASTSKQFSNVWVLLH